MCHSSTSNRLYRYSFEETDLETLNDTQIQETLNKTGEYIIVGNSTESPLSSLLLYNHPTEGFVYNMPPYTTIMDWINGMPVCP